MTSINNLHPNMQLTKQQVRELYNYTMLVLDLKPDTAQVMLGYDEEGNLCVQTPHDFRGIHGHFTTILEGST